MTIYNGIIYLDGRLQKKNIHISSGKIASISESRHKKNKTFNAKNLYIIPGAIDPHVHLRNPGESHKEDWITGSQAAVAGGFTSILDMPNNIPPTLALENIQEKINIAKQNSFVNFGFHLGIKQFNSNILSQVQHAISGIKVYLCDSTGNLMLNDFSHLEVLLEQASKPVLFHAEDASIIQKNTQKFFPAFTNHTNIRSIPAALSAIQFVLNKLPKVYKKNPKLRIVFCHLSSSKELKLIQAFKEKHDIPVFTEVSPHHLFLNVEDNLPILRHLSKVNPPLREHSIQKNLLDHFIQGEIDMLGTDHAPHTLQEKQQPYNKSPAGFPGLETALPLLISEIIKGNLSLKVMVQSTSENPSKIFNLPRKGFIKPDMDADLTLFSCQETYLPQKHTLYSKSGWSPFENHKMSCKIKTTIISGKIAYHNGVFPNCPTGQWLGSTL